YATAQLVRDAQEHGVEVRPVDVNRSDWDCTLEAEIAEALPQRSLPPCGGGTGRGVAVGFGVQQSPPPPTGAPRRASAPGSPPPHKGEGSRPCRAAARLYPRHAEMKGDIRTTHALRLGLRQINGFSEDWGKKIE